MSSGAVDVCVITTIHSDYDARIYDRGIRVLTDAGLTVGFVGPWPYKAQSGVAPHHWRTTPRAGRRLMRPYLGLRTLIAALRLRARVYHFHDLDFLPWAFVLNALTRARVVYDIHENFPTDILHHKEYLPRVLRVPASSLVSALEHFVVPRLAAVVVVVPSLAERFTPLARQLVMVRNVSRLDPRPDLEHEPNLLYSGGVTRMYGALTLLDVGRELKRRGVGTRLVVVNKFVETDLRPVFDRAIASEDLPIDIIPLVPPSELDRVMTRGAIGLVPDEPTPTNLLGMHAKFFDYMAMGLPIVASDLPRPRELLASAGCGVVVPPSNAAAMVDAALQLLGDPPRLQRMRENGMRALVESYSWKTETDKLVALMRTLSQRDDSLAPQPI